MRSEQRKNMKSQQSVLIFKREAPSICLVCQMVNPALRKGRILTLTQQWRYLNLTRNSFYILFPAKGIVSYRLIVSNKHR